METFSAELWTLEHLSHLGRDENICSTTIDEFETEAGVKAYYALSSVK